MDGPSELHDPSHAHDLLGSFTAGLAHELNNTFSVVIGGVGIVREEFADKPLDEEAVTLLDDALSAAREGARLIENLLACVGRQTLRPERIDLADFIGGLESLLRQTLPAGIELRVDVADGLAAWADPARLRQGLLNLVANAREAMSEGGTLTLAAAPVSTAGGGAAISVGDGGCGMDALTLERACEPFFTTRRTRRGRGMGLSVVAGFAVQSGGGLELASDPQRGTTVTITLPCQP